jgi:hypothetical protein
MIKVSGFDLNYLLKKPIKLTTKRKIILTKVFENILNSLENINHDLEMNYIAWKARLEEYRALKLLNTDTNVPEMESTFRKYLLTLQKSFDKFKVIEYTFNPDYIDIYEKKIAAHLNTFHRVYFLERLKDFEKIKFYTWNEFVLFAQNYPDLVPLFKSDVFKKEMIKREIIEMSDLLKLDTYLSNIYMEHNIYDKLHEDREQIFDAQNLQGSVKKDSDPFENYANICAYLNIPCDYNAPLVNYETHSKRATRQIEQNKKPKAAGNGRL